MPTAADGLLAELSARVAAEPFNAIATGIFILAVLHTFVAAAVYGTAAPAFKRVTTATRGRRQATRSECARGSCCISSAKSKWCSDCGRCRCCWRPRPYAGWDAATHYVNDTVNYTEALFVVVIMALASTRPVVELAEQRCSESRPRVVQVGRLVADDSDRRPDARLVHHRAGSDDDLRAAAGAAFLRSAAQQRLKYATLGLLFVNVSIGGTLTHFAAPPVLMVARLWGVGHAVHVAALRLASGDGGRPLDGS